MDSREPEFGVSGRSRITQNDSKCCESSGMSQSGQTSKRSRQSMDSSGQTCCVEDSHARTSATAVMELESKASGQGCGATTQGSFATFDQTSQSWKTSQLSLLGGLIEFSGTWPRAGSMRNGIVYRRVPLVPITTETGSSLWPTPRASMGDHMICWKRAENGQHRCNLEDFIAWLWLRIPGNTRTRGLDVNPDWIDWFGGFPERWTDLRELETASIQQQPNGLAAES